MNYEKIQEILESERQFQPLVALRTNKIATRGGEKLVAQFTVRVGERLQAANLSDKASHRPTVLAVAMRLASQPVATEASASQVVAPVPAPTPAPAVKTVPVAVEEPVRVRTVPSEALQATPAKREQRQLTQFVARGDVIRYQAAIAIAQLLAAVFQLAESDTWEGHERRKELLDALLTEYEAVSKQHVNLSVKQLLCAKEGQA